MSVHVMKEQSEHSGVNVTCWYPAAVRRRQAADITVIIQDQLDLEQSQRCTHTHTHKVIPRCAAAQGYLNTRCRKRNK